MKNHPQQKLAPEPIPPVFPRDEALGIILENLQEILLLVDLQFRVVHITENTRIAVLKNFGVNVTANTSVMDLIAPDRQPYMKELYAEVFEGAERKTVTEVQRGQEQLIIETLLKPARSTSGEIVGAVVIARDITEQQRTENLLRETEERWRFALEGANQAVWDWNLQTGEVFYSDSYKKLYGFAQNELAGRIEEWESRIHPDDRKRMAAAIAEHRQGQERCYESTYRIKDKAGHYKWILARGMLAGKDSDGKPLRMIGTHTDITAQVAAERSYKTLFYSNPLPMWTYDVESLRFLSVNEAAVNQYGYSREEFLSMTLKDIRPAEDVKLLLQVLAQARCDGYQRTLHRHLKKNGEIIFVEVSTAAIDAGTGNTVLVVAHDITSKVQAEKELQKSNERFVLAGKATSQAIYDWDILTDQIKWTEGFQNLFGFDPLRVPLGVWEDLIHISDRQRVSKSLSSAVNDSEKTFWSEEYLLAKNDGSYCHVTDRGFIIRDENGKALRMIGAMQDITERKRLEHELLQNELEKQKAINQASVDSQEQERTEIGKELHDNVNQILTTTKLYLDLAMSNAELKDDLIEKSGKNLMTAINEIRQLSRSLMDPTIGDLGLIDSINDLIENVNFTRKIHVNLHAEKRLELFLNQNQRLTIFRIIQEALNNSLRHAQAKTVSITCKLQGSKAEVCIQDDGVGFDRVQVKRGAGLKNIQNRVYLVNGTYTIETAPGKGCKIKINFPVNN